MNLSPCVFSILFSIFLICSCNPECEDVPLFFTLQTTAPEGHEILIQTNPKQSCDYLEKTNVFFGDVLAESRCIEGIGIAAVVPTTAAGADISVQVPDCERHFVSNFEAINESDFFNTSNFVFPSPPTIQIPTIVPSPPVSVFQAWFSPDVLPVDYCIWFVPDTLPNGEDDVFLSSTQSLELAFCDTNALFHDNPVTGIVDKKSNYISIAINRTSKGLGIEEFEGFFIDINETDYREWVPLCNAAAVKQEDQKREYMMVLTSKQSGRQLVLYQQPL